MVGHLTLTALEIQRDQTVGGAAATQFNFPLDRWGSVWLNNNIQGCKALTVRLYGQVV
jgi:hypothetical protein